MKSLNIRKKLVSLAVASVVSGGAMMAMTAPAHAMNISQNNVGQVLLFPYYTVRNDFGTLFTVTNTTDKTAVFKVRFREALNSREVRDFNVILSPFDHWGGQVVDNGDGASVITRDKTCTSPRLPGMVLNADRATTDSQGEIDFSNALLNDGGGSTMDRVKEGYFEVILMGVSDLPTSDPANTLEYNAKHVNGVPRDCAAVDDLFLDVSQLSYMDAPENILKGHVTYINVANGKAIDAEPTAIENFRIGTSFVYPPSDLHPHLNDGDDLNVAFLDNGVGSGYAASSSVNAVSGLLAAQTVINEFATGTNAATSWVVTFPTKHHYTDGLLAAPFSQQWNGTSCDDVTLDLYNREEGTVVNLSNTNFSPAPPPGEGVELCYEANVIDFNSSSVFGAADNRLGVSTTDVGAAGWARLTYSETPAAVTGVDGMLGLPTIGFSAIVRDADSAMANYGSSIEHTVTRGYVVE